jgi:O-antigen/teichoic acid export membrane protein
MIIIYLKIDQVMIGFMMNDSQVGIYSVSVKLTEALYFLPGTIMISLFPSLVRSKKISKALYHSRLQKLFDFMTWAPFLLIIPVFFLSNFLILFLYGQEYGLAGTVLSISIWALFAIFVKEAVSNYLINENLTKTIFITSFMGAVSNVLLNLVLIPIYGINGAAIATVISYCIAAYGGLVFFKKTRPVFFMLLNSFNLFRLILKANK